MKLKGEVAEFAALLEKHPELWEKVHDILTSKEKQALRLRAVERMSEKDAAAVAGVNQSTMHRNTTRAGMKLCGVYRETYGIAEREAM